MLSYHSALDPYHSAFRQLRIVTASPDERIEFDKLRLLEFYLAFPSLISRIRVPPLLRRNKNRSAEPENRYKFNGQPIVVLNQMRSIQEMGLRLLLSSGFLDAGDFKNGYARLSEKSIPKELQQAITERNKRDETLIQFLVSDLGAFPLLGKDGLKDRTNLMEYRYDPV